jgi:HEAT repeat protein
VALAALGEEARPAAAALTAALKDPDGQVRGAAAAALGNLGVAAAAAVPGLVEQLLEPEEDARRSAARSLARLGAVARPAMPRLQALLQGPDPGRRLAAAIALSGIDPADRTARKVLMDLAVAPNKEMQVEAVQALGELRDPGMAPTLGAALRVLREAPNPAAQALAALGPAARAALPDLLASLASHANEAEVADIAQALGEVGVDTPAVIFRLTALFPGAPGFLVEDVAGALVRLGPAAHLAVPALREILQNAALEIPNQFPAAGALADLSADAPLVVAFLQAAYRDFPHLQGPGELHPQILEILGQLGPAAAPALPLLREALRDANPEYRWRAAEALGRIGPGARDAAPDLTAALKDPDEAVRRWAAHALRRLNEPIPSEPPDRRR